MKTTLVLVAMMILAFAETGHAQTRFESLIRGPFPSPFKESPEAVEANLAEIHPKIQEALKQLVQDELALEQSRQGIESHGYTATSLFLEIRRLQAEGNEAKLAELVTNGSGLANDFFKNLDGFIQDYLDVTMALGYHAMRAKLAEARKQGLPIRSLGRDYKYIEKLKDRYLENKHQYQQPKDTFRTTPYKSFFVVLQKMTVKASQSNIGSISFWASIQKITKAILGGIRLIPSAIRFLNVIFGVKQPTPAGAPLAKSLNEIVSKIGEQRGQSVHVEGAENLPTEARKDTINIFVASHRDAMNDVIALSALKQESMIFFGAPNNFLPRALNVAFGLKDTLIQKLDRNMGFIIVGKGALMPPLQKAHTIVKATAARNFLIFPGGRLPEGLGATMGVREKTFSEEGLVALFEREGYKVNLIPVSMKNNARLFDDRTTLAPGESNDLEVRVHEVIDDQTRRTIMKYGGKEALNVLLRFGLTEALITNQDLVWGQVRAGKIIPTLDRYLGVQNVSNFAGEGAMCREIFKTVR